MTPYKKGHVHGISLFRVFTYNIQRKYYQRRRPLLPSAGLQKYRRWWWWWYSRSGSEIRNAICGVFAAQKITAASSNESCIRDFGALIILPLPNAEEGPFQQKASTKVPYSPTS